jgi:hypothetical protein
MNGKQFGVGLLLLFSSFLFSQNILIWDNDNNSTVIDQETNMLVGCEFGIQQALTENNLEYTTVSVLPENILEYDLLFVTLGKYCLG